MGSKKSDMKRHFLPGILFFLQAFLAITAYAQQSNLDVDYSAYMPQVRAFNKMLSQLPQSGTVLTKEGLQNARTMMNSFAGGKAG
jgi:hypothetical protein